MDSFTKFSLVISLWISFSYGFEEPSYDYQVFDAWTLNSPVCGKGKRQSPIDLGPTSKTINGFPLVFKNYAVTSSNGTITNDGHTVRMTGNWGKSVPVVTGTWVNNARYLLHEVHLHWSKKDDNGTEHSINGKRYACETHFVHYNSKYGNVINALNKTDGLLVIGLLFKIDNNIPNRGLQAISTFAATVKEVNSKSITGNLDLGLFRIESIRSSYSYTGSITTPPCLEHIRWVISNEILSANTAIMKAIRSVKLINNDKTNVRPIQPPNNRKVVLFKK